MTTIHPTHTCFDDALGFLEQLADAGVHIAGIRQHTVVHGICLAPDGELFAHAWVEHDELDAVWQGGIIDGQHVWHTMARPRFYASMRVMESTKYTVDEAVAHNYRTGTYGPWVEAYAKLCGRGNRIHGAVTCDNPSTATTKTES